MGLDDLIKDLELRIGLFERLLAKADNDLMKLYLVKEELEQVRKSPSRKKEASQEI